MNGDYIYQKFNRNSNQFDPQWNDTEDDIAIKN